MENNPTVSNEELRMQELNNYYVLDTPPDFNLDSLTKIASRICHTPIALISLIDENRQWFKSKVGLAVDETPREISFCTHAIQQDDVFIVSNPTEDPRFKDNPLVTGEPYIRYYAGMPLKSHNGYNVGTICVIDQKPNYLDDDKIELLRTLSKQVVNYFEIYKKNRELILLRKSIIHDEKMKSVINISSGISQEINNPLSIILGRIYLLESKLKSDHAFEQQDALKDLNSILNASKRISYIINSLCNFSMVTDFEEVKVREFSEILNQVLILCETKIINSGIYLVIDEIPSVKLKCRPINLAHAFYNVIMNAYETVLEQEEKWINIKMSCLETDNKNNLIVRILNSGTGLHPNIKKNLMNPLFPTHLLEASMGIDLNLAKWIISDCNGNLIHDDLNKKSTFIIQLPVYLEE